MKPLILSTFCLAFGAGACLGSDLPPGVTSAQLLPGWLDQDGNRIAAIELVLEPGWKTYWRQPGDTGLPPSFDWSDSNNLAQVTVHWPAPEAIRSGDEMTLGYHDRLVLPLRISPQHPSRDIDLRVAMDFGVCENICVPAHVVMKAAPPLPEPDPRITAALRHVPRKSGIVPPCHVSAIDDGLRLVVNLPQPDVEAAAIEIPDQPEIWVSTAHLDMTPEGITATADLVPPEARPFDLDMSGLTITLIDGEDATEMQGCALTG
ncbi:protein-disulfide reductase DsbD family protein [Paracoccus sp. Z330]|uniref:Protein-disulfide reductase DsbD family protein n=1 Tax=Paracoccus onchidii TaxID=3017813 RepID=A0ABT4ZD78_9RHOB|nr:protein-disulfide reductase DsbD domain-containing protein [Paracoccus onchidii]MDB6177229.1 protein-disulfide reductase DsbD family protein [Paracoccus onchidii]